MSNKRALLVGINYKNTASELKGCITDVQNMKKFLITSGFVESDITILTDETAVKPTRATILQELLKLILSGATTMVFHYSGHGSHQRDVTGDEQDGEDEGLCPIDYERAGLIVDDELRGLLQCLPEGAKLTCILDCCHSGTGIDLAYNIYERANKFYALKEGAQQDTRGQVICVTGCQDDQTSADAFLENKSQGALTAALMQVLPQKPTLDLLIRRVREFMTKNNFSQIPQIACGRAAIPEKTRLF